MPIDPDAAIGATVGEVSFSWTASDVLLYHLAVGAGSRPGDHVDPDALRWTTDGPSLQVLPSFGVVAPTFHMTDPPPLHLPGCSINLAQVVHGSQAVTVRGPLPTSGSATVRTTLTDVWDKGKAAVIWQEGVAVVGGLALVVAPLAGFSLYGYIANRAATVTAASHNSYLTRIANPSFEASSSAWQLNGASSLRVLRTASAAHTGSHSMEMSNSAADEDAYVFQNLSVKPKTKYSVSAWVNARGFRQPAAAERGLLVWDAQDGLLYTVPLTSRRNGWRRLSFTFPTKADAAEVQLRLYAPRGRVLWDGIHLAPDGPATASTSAAGSGVLVNTVPASLASQTMALQSTARGQADAAGQASNSYRIAEARSLLRYIRKRPIYGWGFGSVASDFSTSYSYELSYLDLLFKAGILGLLLYLSFPVRLIVDALRLRRQRAISEEVSGIGSPGVVVGVVVGILLAGATNPYLFAAFGLVSFFAMLAWLEEAQSAREQSRGS